eukprot:Skav209953  [mRNA]  locus=scaffold102:538624:539196:+ [translate_table: standard]
MSSHCVMMLLALLLVFIAQISAEETNMNVNGKQMVQELTNSSMSIEKNHLLAASNETLSHSKALLRGTMQKSIKHNMSIERTPSVAANDTLSQNTALLRGKAKQSAGLDNGCSRLCPLFHFGPMDWFCTNSRCLCVPGGFSSSVECARGMWLCKASCLSRKWPKWRCLPFGPGNVCICTNGDIYDTHYTC